MNKVSGRMMHFQQNSAAFSSFGGKAREQTSECWSDDVTTGLCSRDACGTVRNSAARMTPLTQPQREFLADQVAAILPREIAAGLWSAWLPGAEAGLHVGPPPPRP